MSSRHIIGDSSCASSTTRWPYAQVRSRLGPLGDRERRAATRRTGRRAARRSAGSRLSHVAQRRLRVRDVLGALGPGRRLGAPGRRTVTSPSSSASSSSSGTSATVQAAPRSRCSSARSRGSTGRGPQPPAGPGRRTGRRSSCSGAQRHPGEVELAGARRPGLAQVLEQALAVVAGERGPDAAGEPPGEHVEQVAQEALAGHVVRLAAAAGPGAGARRRRRASAVSRWLPTASTRLPCRAPAAGPARRGPATRAIRTSPLSAATSAPRLVAPR